MQGLSKTQRSAMARICPTLAGGGAGSLGALAMAHNPGAAVAIAVVAGTISCAIASLGVALPGIIAALSAKEVARIRAEADAEVARERPRQQTALLNAGLDGKLDAALKLLQLQAPDADVLTDPRFSGDTLRALCTGPRAPWETGPRPTVVPARESRSCRYRLCRYPLCRGRVQDQRACRAFCR